MLSYVQETEIDKELSQEINDIENIIEPERFIERHYGWRMAEDMAGKDSCAQKAKGEADEVHEASPPKFLFEEILKDTPTANMDKQLR